jgi:cytochrome c-type biogenesis protein CcmH/NrfG
MSVAYESTRTRLPITARTLRIDRWWLQPVLTQFGLLAFVIYSIWVAFQNADYYTEPSARLARTNNPPPARQCRLTADGV